MWQNFHVTPSLPRMIGTNEQSGIMALTIIDLLNHLKEKQKLKQTNLKVSYIEIYNESIKDLLISEGNFLHMKIRISNSEKIPKRVQP